MTPLILAVVTALLPLEKDVTFKGVGEIELKGTLLLPADAKGPAPGVLLLPGSGPTDRNGNQLPGMTTDLHKQIAERLVAAGIASLRFDKRAIRHYAPQWPKDFAQIGEFFSFDKFVGDAKAAWTFLRSQKEVDPKRTAIGGHSEGGLITSQIAFDTAGKPDAPPALMLMATAGRTLDILVREQVTAGMRRAGMSAEAQKPFTDYLDAAIPMIKAEAKAPPNPPAGLAALFNPSAFRILQAYFTVDPTKLLAPYEGKVLILQGEKDIQILATRDLPALEKTLKGRKKGSVESFIVPSASHNFKKVGDVDKEPGFEGPAEPAALERIVAFMKGL